MKQRFIVVLSLLISIQCWGDPDRSSASTTTEAVKPKVTIDHKVHADKVSNDILIEDSTEWVPLMNRYLAPVVFEKIEALPGIENIQFFPGEEKVQDNYYDKTVVKLDRESNVVLRMAGPTPLTMMFKVTESVKRCKSYLEEIDDGEGGKMVTDKPACGAESTLSVAGPIAIYGTIPGAYSNKTLLLNQVTLYWKIGMNYSKEDTDMDSYFKAERADFPVAVEKVMTWSQAQPMFAEVFLSNPARNALVQVGRVLKTVNQEILKGK